MFEYGTAILTKKEIVERLVPLFDSARTKNDSLMHRSELIKLTSFGSIDSLYDTPNLYKEIAPEVTNGEAHFQTCSVKFHFTLFANGII